MGNGNNRPSTRSIYRHMDVQNALRVLAAVCSGESIMIDGDLVYLNGEFIGRTQEAPCILLAR